MSVIVKSVCNGSVCEKKGIKQGDILLSLNGHNICDVLDYRFYGDSRIVTMVFSDSEGNQKEIKVKKIGDIDSLGLEFDTYLMDKHHSCKNKCVFCFIDQLPKGMRDSLYFKDDDSRLSFLFGNYVTLTNITEYEVQRIIDLHISPVNVSVHTMNPELRVKMMKNPNAGKALDLLKNFAREGISLNVQLVLCPGINDGDELYFSLLELHKLMPSIQSVAAVPVGLTDHRKGLAKLDMYTRDTARQVIDIINDFNNKTGDSTPFAYAADEFYLKAQLPIPDYDYYGEFEQLDNGVGKWANSLNEFYKKYNEYDNNIAENRKVALITGVAAYPLIKDFSESINKKYPNVKVDVFKIINDFFGHNITVSGLVTGGDIIKQVKDLSDYDFVIIPSVMIKSKDEPVFLDDISIDELSEKLNVKIKVGKDDCSDLIEDILE